MLGHSPGCERSVGRWAAGYVFLAPTPERLAKLRPAIPAGYTRTGCDRATSP
jgi:hypothetical protein